MKQKFNYSFLYNKKIEDPEPSKWKVGPWCIKKCLQPTVQLLSMTYIVDVDPDGGALQGVDELVILEVLAEDLARHHVVEQNLQGRK